MKAHHVSFTGTRAGMTNAQKEMVWSLLQELGAKVLTHGNCVGADADVHGIAMRLGMQVRKRPSNIESTWANTTGGEVVAPPDEPLKRDRDIVNDGEVLIGCPDSRQERQRSGTWYTMRYAWKMRKMVYIVFPDGDVVCGTSKETSGLWEEAQSKIVYASEGIDCFNLIVRCGTCFYYTEHVTENWKMKCKNYQCGREENVDALKKYYISEEQILMERLGIKYKRAIVSFRGEYGWLSNFYDVPVVLDGIIYRATENAYQAAKTLDLERRKAFVSVTHADSKRLGYEISLRPDWENIKLDVMEDLLRQKFAELELRDKLLNTGTVELIEGNTWGDHFWGVCTHGWNHLGKLLMKIRNDLFSACDGQSP